LAGWQPSPSMGASSSPRVVVIGASGQLGSDLMQALHNWAPLGLTHADIEVADPASVNEKLDAAAPDAVINCAAFHQVDDCENRPDEAFRVNAPGARNVALAGARRGWGLSSCTSAPFTCSTGNGTVHTMRTTRPGPSMCTAPPS